MMKKEEKSNHKKHQEIHPFASIRKLFIVFSLFCLLLITVGNSLLVFKTMHHAANAAYQNAES